MPATSRAASHQRRRPIVVAGLVLGVIAACNESRPPIAPSPGPAETTTPVTQATPPTFPAPTGTVYRLSGIVTDESGAPVPGVKVELDYPTAGPGAVSSPASHCPSSFATAFCWLQATTDSSGTYRAEFTAGAWSVTPGPGYVYTWSGDSQVDVQPLSVGTTEIVQNLTIRAPRSGGIGESLSVDVDSRSSLCTDLEDWWLLSYRCAVVVVDTSSIGTLRVEARSPGGAAAPLLFFATTGNYSGAQRVVEPGVIEVPIRGGRYHLYIGTPATLAIQQYRVSVSLR